MDPAFSRVKRTGLHSRRFPESLYKLCGKETAFSYNSHPDLFSTFSLDLPVALASRSSGLLGRRFSHSQHIRLSAFVRPSPNLNPSPPLVVLILLLPAGKSNQTFF